MLVVGVPVAAAADAVTAWNATARAAARAACLAPYYDPFHESRAYAMAHLAIHDALNAIDRRSRPYVFDAQADPGASASAAVAAAARDVLVALIAQSPSFEGAPGCPGSLQQGIDRVEADYAAALGTIADGDAKAAGIAVGKAAAAALLSLRAGDGADTPFADAAYAEGTAAGEWRFTDGYPFALLPGWGRVTPFVLAHAAQFRPAPPYPLHHHKYTADFNEVKALGGDNVTTPSARTAEQTEIGLFWNDSSPLMWNRIAADTATARGLGLWENARLFALLNMALADGYVASWDSKYHFRFWRPVTAIRLAGDDGNPDTAADATWTPLQLTYPMPDYDSAHSVEGGAGAEVLARVLGDATGFTACSLTLPPGATCDDAVPVLRSFGSFSQAAAENAISRVYLGIHFRKSVDAGLEHGRRIGQRAVSLFLQPVR